QFLRVAEVLSVHPHAGGFLGTVVGDETYFSEHAVLGVQQACRASEYYRKSKCNAPRHRCLQAKFDVPYENLWVGGEWSRKDSSSCKSLYCHGARPGFSASILGRAELLVGNVRHTCTIGSSGFLNRSDLRAVPFFVF